jgi:hypothetical protein
MHNTPTIAASIDATFPTGDTTWSYRMLAMARRSDLEATVTSVTGCDPATLEILIAHLHKHMLHTRGDVVSNDIPNMDTTNYALRTLQVWAGLTRQQLSDGDGVVRVDWSKAAASLKTRFGEIGTMSCDHANKLPRAAPTTGEWKTHTRCIVCCCVCHHTRRYSVAAKPRPSRAEHRGHIVSTECPSCRQRYGVWRGGQFPTDPRLRQTMSNPPRTHKAGTRANLCNASRFISSGDNRSCFEIHHETKGHHPWYTFCNHHLIDPALPPPSDPTVPE